MGHYNHPAELRHPIAQQALRRIIATGATVRIQAPLIRHINENPADWAELWTTGVRLGAVPYYMFVERDTGPSDYFSAAVGARLRYLPAGLPHGVRTGAHSARAVHERLSRKVLVDGIVDLAGEKVFALQFLQARNPDWVRRPFYARFDPLATWLDELQPAFGEKRFSSSRTASPRRRRFHCAGRRVALGQARAQRPGGDRMSGRGRRTRSMRSTHCDTPRTRAAQRGELSGRGPA